MDRGTSLFFGDSCDADSLLFDVRRVAVAIRQSLTSLNLVALTLKLTNTLDIQKRPSNRKGCWVSRNS